MPSVSTAPGGINSAVVTFLKSLEKEQLRKNPGAGPPHRWVGVAPLPITDPLTKSGDRFQVPLHYQPSDQVYLGMPNRHKER